MSFHPITPGFGQSLLGVANTTTIINPLGTDIFGNEINIYRPAGVIPKPQNISVRTTIIFLLVVALIFIGIVSIYAVVQRLINNYFTERALKNPLSKYQSTDINRTILFNSYFLIGIIILAILAILLALGIIPYLVYLVFH